MRGLIAIAALLALAACGGSNDPEADDAETFTFEEAQGMGEDEEPSYTEGSETYAGEVVAGETYGEYDERRDELESEAGSYAGYGCTVDCSGHEAGYEWAARNGIDDPDSCGGKSWSFIEGCRAYAEENGGY